MFAGETGANFNYFENTGTAASPTFVQRIGAANPLNGASDGFARGLAKYQDYLFVGYSKLRQNSSIFANLDFSKKADQCSISIIHAPTGAFVGEIRYLNSVDEIFDIQIIPEVVRPNILNTQSEDFKAALITPEATYWGKKS
ncbi:MAG: TIGR03032 family protein [Cyclobacteriaceae bacterium]|nr:TIGR03032 family protein [Cyclobacteriaceae bacterium]